MYASTLELIINPVRLIANCRSLFDVVTPDFCMVCHEIRVYVPRQPSDSKHEQGISQL